MRAKAVICKKPETLSSFPMSSKKEYVPGCIVEMGNRVMKLAAGSLIRKMLMNCVHGCETVCVASLKR